MLFLALLIGAYFTVRRSLFIYSAVAILFILMSHGPYGYGLYSASRYVMVLFPCFMVMGVVLDRMPKLKWLVWALSFLILFGLTIWFGSGRWVA